MENCEGWARSKTSRLGQVNVKDSKQMLRYEEAMESEFCRHNLAVNEENIVFEEFEST